MPDTPDAPDVVAALQASNSELRARNEDLEWNDHPDRTRDAFPARGCACGADLSGAADLGMRYSHQVTDLPEVRAQTIQYDRHEVACSCGRRHVADAPPEATGAPPFPLVDVSPATLDPRPGAR